MTIEPINAEADSEFPRYMNASALNAIGKIPGLVRASLRLHGGQRVEPVNI